MQMQCLFGAFERSFVIVILRYTTRQVRENDSYAGGFLKEYRREHVIFHVINSSTEFDARLLLDAFKYHDRQIFSGMGNGHAAFSSRVLELMVIALASNFIPTGFFQDSNHFTRRITFQKHHRE